MICFLLLLVDTLLIAWVAGFAARYCHFLASAVWFPHTLRTAFTECFLGLLDWWGVPMCLFFKFKLIFNLMKVPSTEAS